MLHGQLTSKSLTITSSTHFQRPLKELENSPSLSDGVGGKLMAFQRKKLEEEAGDSITHPLKSAILRSTGRASGSRSKVGGAAAGGLKTA